VTSELNEKYEFIYRLAQFIDEESVERDEGYLKFHELAALLNRIGYRTTEGETYDEGTRHNKGISVMVMKCWEYVEENYSRDEAEKVARAVRDRNGECQRSKT
jgi:HEPN domain-containing protein